MTDDPCKSPRHCSVSNREEALKKFRPVDSLLSQERRLYDATKQLMDDTSTVIHHEDRQGQAEVALIIEAHVAFQLKEEVKEMPTPHSSP